MAIVVVFGCLLLFLLLLLRLIGIVLVVELVTSLLHESAKVSEAIGDQLEVEVSRTTVGKGQVKALHRLLILTVIQRNRYIYVHHLQSSAAATTTTTPTTTSSSSSLHKSTEYPSQHKIYVTLHGLCSHTLKPLQF